MNEMLSAAMNQLNIRGIVYLIMSVTYMFVALKSCDAIRQDPYDNKPWLIALPSLILTLMLLALMARDLMLVKDLFS